MKERTRKKNEKKKKIFTRFMYRKFKLVVVIISALILILTGRILYLNKNYGVRYSNAVLGHLSYSGAEVPYERGTITDRNGVTLASCEATYNVIMNPNTISQGKDDKYVKPTLEALSKAFGFNYDDLYEKYDGNREKYYLFLGKGMEYSKVREFNSMAEEDSDIKGITFETVYKRVYPYDSLASHVIGYTNSGNAGAYGIEQYYNDYLNGTDGRSYGYYDNELNLVETKIDPVNGATVVSTIDTFCQTVVEDEINNFLNEYKCKNVAVILMNPNSGEIYAMASNKGYNLNDPRDLSSLFTEEELANMTDEEKSNALVNAWRNYTVCDSYEPGSTYKLITIAAALEENLISTDSVYDCGGSRQVGIYSIRCSNRGGHGPLTLTQAIEQSCNIALMDIGDLLQKDTFLRYQKFFGFGQKTGIDLPGESSGILVTDDVMGDVELATSTFGQSFNVTMVQMCAAYSSLINGGYYYRPHVVSQIIDSNGVSVYSADDTLMKLTVSKETSDYLKMATQSVVENGTAKSAAVEGYKVGGKTGTAQKGKRTERKFVVSFIGSVPADNPQLVSYVVLDEIDDEQYYNSSKLASVMTSDILSRVVAHLGIYPEDGNIDYHEGEFKDEIAGEIEEGAEGTMEGEGGDQDAGEVSGGAN